MHIPSKFRETNTDVLCKMIADHPLGTLISSYEEEIDANHIPFYVNTSDSGLTLLQSHIAKANPLWQTCKDGQKVLVIFQGPNAYISPSFYPSKARTGKAVPTWNYSVVHARGRIEFKSDDKWIAQLLETITHAQESNSKNAPWTMDDAPEKYISRLINAVVGLEITVDEIVGNFKLSQNKPEEDYEGVISSLENSDNHIDTLVSRQMQRGRK